jgi:hypothetical protein
MHDAQILLESHFFPCCLIVLDFFPLFRWIDPFFFPLLLHLMWFLFRCSLTFPCLSRVGSWILAYSGTLGAVGGSNGVKLDLFVSSDFVMRRSSKSGCCPMLDQHFLYLCWFPCFFLAQLISREQP